MAFKFYREGLGSLKKGITKSGFPRIGSRPRKPLKKVVALRADPPTLLSVKRLSELVKQDSQEQVNLFRELARQFGYRPSPSKKLELWQKMNKVAAKSWGVNLNSQGLFTRSMIPKKFSTKTR
ncbi:MAG: hypothetical protein QT03_C0001G1048 [archaeon GW2011_AR10]|uniref:Uncharacterized protein n=1 Tax=Candidatus Iainarchaeum sp. TaxID=3101447 RepID=A0A7J4ITW1_9ARCH|nr:MAG: hypothetical protein QT03_C0001G1048 [archaeon GW2011_AR10]HIH07809.1 hypothetical protein [Candidatus Diapherotrites archaeon]